MSINTILSSASSALETNQVALSTTSTNVANVNNPDYTRRVVEMQSLSIGGQSLGVQVGEIRRMAADFLTSEVLSSHASAGTFDAMSNIHDEIQTFLGQPDSQSSLPSLVSQALAYPSQLTLDPTSIPLRSGYLQQLQSTLDSISSLSSQVQQTRADADSQIGTDVGTANGLISDVFQLNTQIVTAQAVGQDASALEDQRDSDLRNLSDLMAINTYDQPNGSVNVTTADGFPLVSSSYVQLSYAASGQTGTNIVYPQIEAQTLNSQNGQPIGNPVDFDSHITQGQIRGLLTMRDSELPNFLEQLGELASGFADAVNAAHSDSTAVPPPNTLAGRDTGLLAGDSAGFSGATTLAVVADDGTLVRKIDLDFDAGTYSVDNGAPVAFSGGTIGDVIGDINTALAGVGTATFSGGALTIAASDPTEGIAFSQPATGGSDRGGHSFSQFFGLNDLIQGTMPSNFDTGLSASDAAGFPAGEEIDLALTGPDGKTAQTFTYTTTGGETIGDIVTALQNPATGFGTYLNIGLDSDGQLTVTPKPGYDGYNLDVTNDTTARGTTNTSFTQLFGLGRTYQMQQASGLEVAPGIMSQPDLLALAHLDIDASSAPGDLVAAVGDSSGAQALAALATASTSFGAAGNLQQMSSSIGDYASLIVSNISTDASSVQQLDQSANAVKDEVETRRSSVEGVNLDEELSNMIVYQQAYNAAARMVTVAKELYDTLLQAVQ